MDQVSVAVAATVDPTEISQLVRREAKLLARGQDDIDDIAYGRNVPSASDVRFPGGDATLAPLSDRPGVARYRFAASIAAQLKAEGLGSMGVDTPDARRIALLRACKLMDQHGMRPSHIAQQAPVAVVLAFTPNRGEIFAAQLSKTAAVLSRQEEAAREWSDPKWDGPTPAAPKQF